MATGSLTVGTARTNLAMPERIATISGISFHRLGLPFPAPDLPEGSDGHFDLVPRGSLGGDLLEPQARGHQRPHHGRPLELRPQPEDLVGEARDHRNGDD